MCLKIKEGFKKREDARAFSNKPLIAGRTIKAFKVLEVSEGDLEFFSIYRATPYRSGEEKKVKKFSFDIQDVAGTWRLAVNKGLHSYKNQQVAAFILNQSKESKAMYAIAECTIPKGTPYFKNEHSYVSLQLDLPSLSFDIDKKKRKATPNDKWVFCSNSKNTKLQLTLPS